MEINVFIVIINNFVFSFLVIFVIFEIMKR